MTPTITKALALENELKSRFHKETDPLIKELIWTKIHENSRLIIREKVSYSLASEAFNRSYGRTKDTPIKSGLRNVTGHSLPDKVDHWYWDTASEKDARRLERVRGQIKELLFHEADKTLTRKFTLLGGVKKTLTSLGLAVILDLDEETRRGKSAQIMKLIEGKLNGEEKIPFC